MATIKHKSMWRAISMQLHCCFLKNAFPHHLSLWSITYNKYSSFESPAPCTGTLTYTLYNHRHGAGTGISPYPPPSRIPLVSLACSVLSVSDTHPKCWLYQKLTLLCQVVFHYINTSLFAPSVFNEYLDYCHFVYFKQTCMSSCKHVLSYSLGKLLGFTIAES